MTALRTQLDRADTRVRELEDQGSRLQLEQGQREEAWRALQKDVSTMEQNLAVAAVERRSADERAALSEERRREDLRYLASREEAADARCGELRQQAEAGLHERQKLQEELAICAAEQRRLEAVVVEQQQRLEGALAARAAAQANP